MTTSPQTNLTVNVNHRFKPHLLSCFNTSDVAQEHLGLAVININDETCICVCVNDDAIDNNGAFKARKVALVCFQSLGTLYMHIMYKVIHFLMLSVFSELN